MLNIHSGLQRGMPVQEHHMVLVRMIGVLGMLDPKLQAGPCRMTTLRRLSRPLPQAPRHPRISCRRQLQARSTPQLLHHCRRQLRHHSLLQHRVRTRPGGTTRRLLQVLIRLLLPVHRARGKVIMGTHQHPLPTRQRRPLPGTTMTETTTRDPVTIPQALRCLACSDRIRLGRIHLLL